MSLSYKSLMTIIPATFNHPGTVNLDTEYRTRKGAKIWSAISLHQLTEIRALNCSYAECAELLDCNLKAVRRAVLIHNLQPDIDNLRSNKIIEVMK